MRNINTDKKDHNQEGSVIGDDDESSLTSPTSRNERRINLEKAHEGDRSVTRQERDRTSPTSRNDRRINLEKDDNRTNHQNNRAINLERNDARTQNKNNRGIDLDKDDREGQNNQPDRRNRIRLDKNNKDNSKLGKNKNSNIDLDKPVDKDRSERDRTGKTNQDREKDDSNQETLVQKKQRVREAVRTAVAAVNRRYGGIEATPEQLSPILTPIKLRYELVYLKAVTTGEKWLIKGKVNPTYNDLTDVFDKEESDQEDWGRKEVLVEAAFASLRHKYYKGNSDPKHLEHNIKKLPPIQQTIARIQNKYFIATEVGADNTFEVGGHQFFVDQARNNYVYPLSAAQKAKIITKNGKITTKEEVIGYEYNRYKYVKMKKLRYMLDQIQPDDGKTYDEDETAMLIASLAAEPFRYPPSHVTNLIGLHKKNENKSAFDNMIMTTGGTDPKSTRKIKQDRKNNPQVGTVPSKVRERQFDMITDSDFLKRKIDSCFEENKQLKDTKIVRKFKAIIKYYIEKVR